MSTWASGGDRLGREAAGVHGLLQLVLDEAERVAHADLAPGLPAEHRRAVEQHDALDLGLAAGLEPAERADAQHGERIGRAGGHRGARGALGHLGLDLLEDGGEELALVGELVVEGPARHAGRAHDLLGADRRRSPRSANRGRAAAMSAARVASERSACLRPLDIHTVCIHYAYSLYAT